MKRKERSILIGVLTLCMIGCAFWLMGGRAFFAQVIPFDPERTGVVDVIVTDSHGRDDMLYYYNIGAGLAKQECDAFEPETMSIYRVDPDGLECYIDREKNKVLNRLLYIRIEDKAGNEISPTPPMEAAVTQAATLEHNIFSLHIFEVSGEIFLQAELNVNLWCPYELYWYDQHNGRLVELYTFDCMEVVGMRIRNLELAR